MPPMDDDLRALPAPVRAILTILLQHGVAAAIALFAVWQLSARLNSDIRDVNTKLEAHAALTTTTSQAFASFATAQAIQTQQIMSILRQMCVNTANSPAQQRECLR